MTACSTGGGEGSADGKRELSVMWSQDTRPGMEAAVERFEAANPDVHVKLSWMSATDFFSELRTLLAAGNQSDVFMAWPGNGNAASAQVLSESGYLADLSDQPWVKDLPKSILDVSTSEPGGKGEVVEFITSASAFGGLYNSKALDDAGLEIPTKWSEVIPFCKAARDAGKVAYALGAATDPMAGVLAPYSMVGTAVYVDDPDFDLGLASGETRFVGSGWEEALDKNVQMAEAGCYNDGFSGTQHPEAAAMLNSGEAIGMLGIGLFIPGFTSADAEVIFAPFPATDDPDRINLLVGAQQGLAVNAKSDNVELAKEFVAFMATPEENVAWAEALPGTIPTLRPADYEPVNQFQEVVLDFVDTAGPFPDQNWPNPEVQQKLIVGMQDALIGRKTVKSVLEDMQIEFDAGVKK
ncbi:raffinose/stachyose/melibiose transport system substrate-binding protein [Microbacterium sp. W4I4]|uniref:ABC transporter substrate-binding protein n=1 Tax=Microbacterium sp. W4I4 TaxID=3042295 RepID=UPI00277FC678|nr:ABC transporter substrate-binding protein [Microbacterium sp. W4I4]MDQ0615352.1 raffinose/stachyose/melibiose transport system substrate-binding protein [Microbacterium sp. W4I4]